MEGLAFFADGDLGDDGVDGDDSSSFLCGALSLADTLALSLLSSDEGAGEVVSATISRCRRTDQIS